MFAPIYRALLEQALSDFGVLEPEVTEDGRFLDSGRDLLAADDGLALVLQAFVAADAAIGATTGRELLKTLADEYRVEGMDLRYQALREEAHSFSFGDLVFAFEQCAARARQRSTWMRGGA